jgi:hypothetical protein
MKTLEAGDGLFPLPQLTPPPRPHSRSRRVWQRFQRSNTITTITNNLIQSLNQLSLSFYSESVLYNQARNLSACHVSSRQLRVFAHLHQCATRFVSRRTMNTIGSSVVSDDNLDGFDFSLFNPDTCQYSALAASAIPIEAEKLSLPSSSTFVDLLPLLPENIKLLYSSESNLLRPVPEIPKQKRSSVLCASPRDYIKTIFRLSQLGMVEFTENPKVVNGVFGVPKGENQIRLIIDARPANSVFMDSPKVELPTPDILSDLQIDRDQPLFIAKIDLDNFYHRLRLPNWLRPYFALPPVHKCDVGLSDSTELIYPCCTTLPMGWSHSVFIAQAIHENILNQSPHFPLCDRLNRQNDLLLNRVRHQVYIDDLNIFGSNGAELCKIQQDYTTQVTQLGFVVKESKVVLPSATGVECVGIEINGNTKECGVSVNKLWNLCQETLRFLSRETATGLQLSRLVGKWSWAILVNRPAFSVFSAVYRFIECAGPKNFAIWSGVRRELNCIIGLAPLLFTNISKVFFSKTIATDASSEGQGVVATSSSMAEFCDSDLSTFVKNSKWSTIISSKWRSAEHINVLELRAVISSIRWALSYPSSIGCRVLVFSDSAVAVGAISKGRSSSPQLLSRLRLLASLLLSSGLRLTILWIPTSINPADEPSRNFQ